MYIFALPTVYRHDPKDAQTQTVKGAPYDVFAVSELVGKPGVECIVGMPPYFKVTKSGNNLKYTNLDPESQDYGRVKKLVAKRKRFDGSNKPSRVLFNIPTATLCNLTENYAKILLSQRRPNLRARTRMIQPCTP